VTLLDRLQYVSQRYGSARALSVAAGLSAGYIGTLTTRLRRNPDAGMDGLPAVQIAHAAGVTVNWLLAGEEPRDFRVPRNLAAVIRSLPEGAYPAVVTRQAQLYGAAREGDLSEDVWRDYLDGLYRELRHVELAAAAAVAGIRERAPRAK
jgi:hypothetical protein